MKTKSFPKGDDKSVVSIVQATISKAVFLFAAMLACTTAAQAACGDAPGRGIDWQDCRKTSLILNDSDLADSNFTKANLSSSDLRNSRLVGSIFVKSNLVRASLAGVNATKADFEGVIASRTNFSGGIFKDANFAKAEMTRIDFSDAVLENTDFSKGQASRTLFKNASLKDVNFDFTSMARSDFRDAKFEGKVSMNGTFLFRARFEGVDLSNVSGLEDWQLRLACGNADTKLPAGFDRPETWPCDSAGD